MPGDSPKSEKSDEIELIDEYKKEQDLKNNNNNLIYPRPTTDLIRPTAIPPRFGPPNFPGWLYRGLTPAFPVGYPVGRGHELMRRLCTMNPAFAQSIIEDYIRPSVSHKFFENSTNFSILRRLNLQVRDDDVVLEIECGSNTAMMYLSRLCQGSKGPCIWFQESWITPNEFQYISGRETAKDWKRSIRHCGKSMKLLLTKGILTTHPPICDCDGCRISSPIPHSTSEQLIQMQQAVSDYKCILITLFKGRVIRRGLISKDNL